MLAQMLEPGLIDENLDEAVGLSDVDEESPEYRTVAQAHGPLIAHDGDELAGLGVID